MSDGNAESADDRVADELFDRSTVALDRRRHNLEVAVKEPAERLSIKALPQPSRANQITEEGGHEAAAKLGHHREPPPAPVTELGRFDIGRPTPRTSPHAESLGQSRSHRKLAPAPLAAGDPAAFAEPSSVLRQSIGLCNLRKLGQPHSGGPSGAPTQVHVIATGGMPGWQIALIAAGAALAAAAVAVLLDRAQMARKAHATTA